MLEFKKLLDSSHVDEDSKSTLFNIASQVREQAAEGLLAKLKVENSLSINLLRLWARH